MFKRKFAASCLIAGALAAPTFLSAQALHAQETPVPAPAAPTDEGLKISGVAGLDVASHFISYGYDVWGTGGHFGENSTINPYAELKLDFDVAYLKVGTWWDVNDNVVSGIGGHLQEVDIYYGLFVPVGKFTLGVTYQDWVYGGGVEKILDLTVAFDDSEYLGAWKMSPTFTAHKVLSSDLNVVDPATGRIIKDTGWCFVLGVAPGFTVMESKSFDVNLSFPIAIAFGDGDFYAESGWGYFSGGAAVSVPLKFIPAKYGAWSVGASVIYYFIDDDAVPTNRDDNFITAKFGFSVGF